MVEEALLHLFHFVQVTISLIINLHLLYGQIREQAR